MMTEVFSLRMIFCALEANDTKMKLLFGGHKAGETRWWFLRGLYFAYVHVGMSLNCPHPPFFDYLWIEIKTSKHLNSP